MKNILTLLRLEFKNKFGSRGNVKQKNVILKWIISLAFYVLMVYMVFSGIRVLFEMFNDASLAFESLVFLFALLFIFLCITGISNTIKVLYYKGDNAILMRFPVNGSEIFLSKTLFLLINQFFISAVVIVLFMLSFASVVEVTAYFYAMIPVVVFFMSAIPFLISNILAIPIMHLTNKIRNKFGLILILMSIIVTAVFAVYMVLFNAVVNYLNDSNYSVFSDEVISSIKNACKFLLPAKYFADILMQKELYAAFPVLIFLTGTLLIGTITVIVKLYANTLLKSVEIEGSAFKRITKNRVRSVFNTLIKKEFLQVFRSVNYSFQYFVLACSMPLMVYFCNNIATVIGKNSIGEQIATGVTILVMLIFSVVITSFAATSVTREGNNFYHTKTMPVSVHKQLLAKFVMYISVSFIANLLCIVILMITKLISVKIGFWVFGIIQVLSIAMIFRFMRFDVRKPYFNLSGEGEVINNNPNTTSAIALGFLISIAVGSIAIICSYYLTELLMMLTTSIIAALFVIYCLIAYFYKTTSAYNKITK